MTDKNSMRATRVPAIGRAMAAAIVAGSLAQALSGIATTPTVALARTTEAHVQYQGHVQSIGWQDYVSDGDIAGTWGQSKRVEAINVRLENADGEIEVDGHVQGIGWQGWQKGHCGTSGQSRRVESIKLRLVGNVANDYDIYYRVHAQTHGWLGWVKNGAEAGTTGQSKRLEAIQIRLQPKNVPFASIDYQAHVQSIGWQDYVSDGIIGGTEGRALRVEALRFKIDGMQGNVNAIAHVQRIGWQDPMVDYCGTSGRSLRVEAMQLELSGEVAKYYDLWYRVHAQTYGWLPWTANGGMAGTSGKAKRLEAIQVRLVPKAATFPDATPDKPSASATSTPAPKPTATSLTKLTGGGKSVTATWAKQTKNVNGYELQYATNKDLKNAKTVSIDGNAATSKAITGLAEDTEYWVRVRTWAKSGTDKVYSAWSDTKSARTNAPVPTATSLTAFTGGTKSVTATWAKQTKNVNGYELQYANNASLANAKTVSVDDSATTTKALTSLADDTQYWARVRTWTNTSAGKVYSAWSATKSARTAKSMLPTPEQPKPTATSLTSVTGGDKAVTATWQKQTTNVSGYELQYATSTSFANAKSVTVTSNATTTRTINSLNDGTTYYVRIRTYRDNGTGKAYSAWSGVKSALTNVPVAEPVQHRDPQPTSLTGVTGGDKSVTAKWNKQTSGTDGYELQYATSNSFTNAKSVTINDNSTTSKTIDGLADGTTYYVRVRTWCNDAGMRYNSQWSASKSALTNVPLAEPEPEPAQPEQPKPDATSLTSVTGGDNSVTAKWERRTTNVDGYEVQYATNGSFDGADTITISGNTTTTKTITGLADATTYHVRVRTFKGTGSDRVTSDWSASKSALTNVPLADPDPNPEPEPTQPTQPAKAPATPTMSNLVAQGDDVVASWSSSEGASRYEVQVATSASFDGADTVDAGNATSKSLSLEGTATYHVRVRAVNAAGASDWSAPIAGRWSERVVTDTAAWTETIEHPAVTHVEHVPHETVVGTTHATWNGNMCAHCGAISIFEDATSNYGLDDYGSPDGDHIAADVDGYECFLRATNAWRAKYGTPGTHWAEPLDAPNLEDPDTHRSSHRPTNWSYDNFLGTTWAYDSSKTWDQNWSELDNIVFQLWIDNPLLLPIRQQTGMTDERIRNNESGYEAVSQQFQLTDPEPIPIVRATYTDETVTDQPAWTETVDHEAVTHVERTWSRV